MMDIYDTFLIYIVVLTTCVIALYTSAAYPQATL